ncbi:Uncharacterized protein TCM_031043, partial [Theobroma cacao]
STFLTFSKCSIVKLFPRSRLLNSFNVAAVDKLSSTQFTTNLSTLCKEVNSPNPFGKPDRSLQLSILRYSKLINWRISLGNFLSLRQSKSNKVCKWCNLTIASGSTFIL